MVRAVIEWDRQRVIAAQGSVAGQRAALQSVLVLERGDEAAGNAQLVQQLRQAVPSSAKSPQPVALILPRQQVTIHHIELPLVPDDEIPDMIRLQAAMRLTVPVESVCMDFVPLPVPAGSTTRDVLLVTTPQDTINEIRRTLSACQLELAEVRVSSFCIAAALANAGQLTAQADPAVVDVLVLLRDDFLEVTVLRGTQVVFAHSGAAWTAPDGIERAVRAELSRARMAAAESLGEYRVGRLVLIGRPEITAAVSDQIAARMDQAQIQRLDPLATLFSGSLPAGVPPETLVAVAGALTADGSRVVEAVDLINPRRAPERRDLRRVKILGGALAALLVFALVWNWRQSRLAELQAELDVVETEASELRDGLNRGQPDSDLAKLVEQWVARDLNWLDEITRLKQLLPGTDRLIVRNVQFGTRLANGIGTVRLEGTAKTRDDVEELARRLTEAGYLVTPYNPEEARISGTYPVAITLQLTIPERTPAAAAAKPTARTSRT